jgi:thioredoxin 1
MEIVEVSYEELQLIKKSHLKPLVVFVYTPLCGTCKLARRMLEISIDSFEGKIIAVSCNLNHMPKLAEEWKLQNVPSLVLFNKNKLYNIIFSFQSVPNIVTNIKEFTLNSRYK